MGSSSSFPPLVGEGGLAKQGRMSNRVSDGSRVPRFVVPDHGVEGCDQLAHDGNDSDLCLLALGPQALAESGEDGIMHSGAERGHIEDVADRLTASPDTSLAFELAAVVVIGGEPDQGGDLPVGQAAEFGQQCDQCGTQDRADTGSSTQ